MEPEPHRRQPVHLAQRQRQRDQGFLIFRLGAEFVPEPPREQRLEVHLVLLDRSFRRTLVACLLLSAGPSTAAALLIAAPGCDWLARDDIRCFEWPEELGACLDREQAVEELNMIDGRCSDRILSVESAEQRDGVCCYKVISRNFSPRCPAASGSGVGGSGPLEGSGGHSEGGGGQSQGGGGQSQGGGGQSQGGGGQSQGGGGQSQGGGGRF